MGLCAAILDIPFCSHTGIKTMRKGGATSQGPPALLSTGRSLTAGFRIRVQIQLRLVYPVKDKLPRPSRSSVWCRLYVSGSHQRKARTAAEPSRAGADLP